MNVYAIGDLHLSGYRPKPMSIFGGNWENHDEKIRQNWLEIIKEDDIVLVPGDISWALNLEEAKPDLEWLGKLPGKKVIIRGNHDYWWSSPSKVRAAVPQGVYAIQNDSIVIGDVAICGTRLWDDPEISFYHNIEWIPREDLGLGPEKTREEDDEKIYQRELGRLSMALESITKSVKKIIVMLHYPPTDFSFPQTRATEILQKYGTDICVYGHLHTLKKKGIPKFPVKKWGMEFYLVSSDFVDFKPVKIYSA